MSHVLRGERETIGSYLGWVRGPAPETVRYGFRGQIWTRSDAEKARADEKYDHYRRKAIGQEVLDAITVLWPNGCAGHKLVAIQVGDLHELLNIYAGQPSRDYGLINRCKTALDEAAAWTTTSSSSSSDFEVLGQAPKGTT